MTGDSCTKGGQHNWRKLSERGGWLVHECVKCKTRSTRRQGGTALAVSLEDVARVAHEANRAWQIATGDPDPSPHWDDAPAWQRESAIDGVAKALDGVTPAELHAAWCAARLADGWAHGPVKDGAAKTHPCLVPYEDLPAEQRVKDELFCAVVAALAGGPS